MLFSVLGFGESLCLVDDLLLDESGSLFIADKLAGEGAAALGHGGLEHVQRDDRQIGAAERAEHAGRDHGEEARAHDGYAGGVPVVIGGHGKRRTPALAAKYADEFNVPFGSIADTEPPTQR